MLDEFGKFNYVVNTKHNKKPGFKLQNQIKNQFNIEFFLILLESGLKSTNCWVIPEHPCH